MLTGFCVDTADQRIEAMEAREGQTFEGAGLCVVKRVISVPEGPVVETWVEVTNVSSMPVAIRRLDGARGLLPKGDYEIAYYTSTGPEFLPESRPLRGTVVLEETAGRSSRTLHPYVGITGSDGHILCASVAWSGNWIARFQPVGEAYDISLGLSDWRFEKLLAPGERLDSPRIYYVDLPHGDMDAAAIAFGRYGKAHIYPPQPFGEDIPVAWNHWWPYEDVEIDEDVFRRNVDVCQELGIDVCTLDAGWFGAPDPCCNDDLSGWSENVDWYCKRGDWHSVNTIRFPSGIRALSDYVHGKGMRFGIWCEIEALGKKAELAETNPEYAALREGASLGYVCFGSPAVCEWAFRTLERLIVEYRVDWIKVDFNLNPTSGCDRADHGHGTGDGLHAHVRGLYDVLDRVRAAYPHVFLENCSSGGRRIDLELARHTHGAFLSDPDYTPHHLQTVWGATSMLHPSAIFHFSWSQTRVVYESAREMDPIHPDFPASRFDYILRANFFNRFAISYRLPDLAPWQKERMAYHIQTYKERVRRFVCDADLYRLTPGWTPEGKQGWIAGLFVMPDLAEALLLAFRLPGGEERTRISLKGLCPDTSYDVYWEDSGQHDRMTGRQLMEYGVEITLPQEGSELAILRKAGE